MNYWTKEDVNKYFDKYNSKSEIQSVFSNMDIDLSKLRPYEYFNIEDQLIIYNAYKEENKLDRIEENLYIMKSLDVNTLPRSYWENPLFQIRFSQNKFDEEQVDGFKRIIRKIKNIENNIIKNGYNVKFPILIIIMEKHNSISKIGIDGGHHRVQAVRNLISKGKLKKHYKIPAIIYIRKDDLKYKKLNYDGITDYSMLLDGLINNKRNLILDKPDDKGFYYVRLYFGRNTNPINMKITNNTVMVKLGIVFDDRLKQLPIVFKFIRSKVKGMKIKVKKHHYQEVNDVLNKLIKLNIIDEIINE